MFSRIFLHSVDLPKTIHPSIHPSLVQRAKMITQYLFWKGLTVELPPLTVNHPTPFTPNSPWSKMSGVEFATRPANYPLRFMVNCFHLPVRDKSVNEKLAVEFQKRTNHRTIDSTNCRNFQKIGYERFRRCRLDTSPPTYWCTWGGEPPLR